MEEGRIPRRTDAENDDDKKAIIKYFSNLKFTTLGKMKLFKLSLISLPDGGSRRHRHQLVGVDVTRARRVESDRALSSQLQQHLSRVADKNVPSTTALMVVNLL